MAFKKGQSGNPGGRAKEDPAFKARCRAAVDAEVIEKWISEVRSMGEHWVKCSELLAAYGYGKPTQAVEVSGKDGAAIELTERMKTLTTEQLDALIAATAPSVH